jgi:hypothetical protein
MADALLHLVREPARFYLFTGKGGVGKTSLECATAVGLHTIFPHPTLSETMGESMLAAFGRVIHV